MKHISEESKEKVELVFEHCDIYHIDGYPVQNLKDELPRENISPIHRLRWNMLFGNSGLLTNVTKYNSDIRRIFSAVSEGDYPNGFRQRLNIIHILLGCNFDTLVPVHISMSPPSTGLEVDLFKDDFSNWSHITHPGYTRAVGSVFLNTPLKNVLLYFRKDKKVTLKEDPRIRKIESTEQLFTYYKGLKEADDIELRFFMPGRNGRNAHFKNIVTHFHNALENELPILKANEIKTVEKKGPISAEKAETIHPSRYYYTNSIPGFVKYTRELIKNTYNIYTEDIDAVKTMVKRNFNQLVSAVINDSASQPLSHTNFAESHNIPDGAYSGIFDKNRVDVDEVFNNLLKEFTKFTKTVVAESNVEERCNFEPRYTVTEVQTFNLPEIVEKNEYKGIALYLNENKIREVRRDIFEFLYCINPEKTLTRLEDDSIVIINCGHEFWKTKENYSEDILNESFLKYE